MTTTHRDESFPGVRRPKPLARRRRKQTSYDNLLNKVRNIVVAKAASSIRRWVTVEEISDQLGARFGDVQKSFYQLVREGILARAENVGPHDSTRDSFLRQAPLPDSPKRGRSGWAATRWPFRA